MRYYDVAIAEPLPLVKHNYWPIIIGVVIVVAIIAFLVIRNNNSH